MPRCPSCYRRLAHGATCPRDGAKAGPERQNITFPGKPVVAGYTVGELLGFGGFAAVWAGKRESDGLEVALKVGRDPRRLGREADAMAQVGPPHVPEVYDRGPLARGMFYIAMEQLHGRPLVDALETSPDLPGMRWVRRVSMAVLDVLGVVHEFGLVHCDLKPENVFLTSESPIAVRLFDFGLAKGGHGDRHGKITRTGAVVGTAEYMAPEQVRGAAHFDARTDVYAFGIMLYELITLRPPFTGDLASVEHGHTSLRPPLLRQFAAVPQPIENVVMACLAKDPDKRPPNATAVTRALSRAFARATPSNTPLVMDSRASLLVEKRQPAVLVVADTDAGSYAVSEFVKQRGGFVAWQRGSRYMCVFAGFMVEDPGRSAVETAHSMIADLDARAAIHLAPITLRRRRRGPPAVKGRAVDQPEKWLPEASWEGVVMTALFARTRPQGSTAPAPTLASDEFFIQAGDELRIQETTTLVGRGDVMKRAEDSLRTTLDSASPGLLTIIGESGLGRSRIARDIARRVSTICPEAQTVFLSIARDPRGAEGRARSELAEVIPAADTVGAANLDRPVVLIADDLHLASNDFLNWLEYATLDHEALPLWVVATALPRLTKVRNHWGERANRHDLLTLAPLAGESAVQLAAELLLPAEFPPEAFLNRMVSWTGGNPQLLAGLAAELERQGIVRKRAYGEGWHVATAEVEQFPTAATPRQWLAARELAALPPELAACVRVCAVLGTAFWRDELAHVQDAIEEHGGAGTPVDTDVGLRELLAAGILERTGPGRFVFASPALGDAVHQLLSAGDQERIHRYASEYWRARLERDGDDGDAMAGFARHAAASGSHEEAARYYVRLGDLARLEHDDPAAEENYSAALRLAPDSLEELHIKARSGRGRVRHRLHRTQEAYEDLRTARTMCEARGDTAFAVHLLLEEATAADAAMEFARAQRSVEEAREMIQGLKEPELENRVLLGLGRNAWRQGDAALAADLLRQAFDRAEEIRDEETAVIALLLLAPALVFVNRLEEAELFYDEAITRCERSGNKLHQCRAYANRMFLWSAKRMPEMAEDDLLRSIQLARQIGNPDPEHIAAHNLAEHLYWSGKLDDALSWARRARDLQLRFHKGLPFDLLLLARIHAARTESRQAEACLQLIADECNPEEFEHAVRLLHRAMHLVLAGSNEQPRWEELMKEAEGRLPNEEFVELIWWRAYVEIRRGEPDKALRLLSIIRDRLEDVPIWRNRVDFLERSVQ